MKPFPSLPLVLLLLPAAYAQQETFTVNPDASEVKINLSTTHEVVNGTFHVQSGSVTFEPAASRMSGLVVVVAGSGKTGNDTRDKKMKKDILKADQFNTVSFTPKSYSGVIASSGDSTIQLSGTFTLLGIGHDITVPTQIHIVGSTATAKADFVIPYVQWGLKNPSFLFWKADNDVAINLTLAGAISK